MSDEQQDLAYYKSLATNLQRQQSIWHAERAELEQQVWELAQIVMQIGNISCSAKATMMLLKIKAGRQEASEARS